MPRARRKYRRGKEHRLEPLFDPRRLRCMDRPSTVSCGLWQCSYSGLKPFWRPRSWPSSVCAWRLLWWGPRLGTGSSIECGKRLVSYGSALEAFIILAPFCWLLIFITNTLFTPKYGYVVTRRLLTRLYFYLDSWIVFLRVTAVGQSREETEHVHQLHERNSRAMKAPFPSLTGEWSRACVAVVCVGLSGVVMSAFR